MAEHDQIRIDLERIYRAAVSAVDPARLVRRAFDGDSPDAARFQDAIAAAARVFVLAVGKASYPMAAELERRLSGRIADGVAVVHSAPSLHSLGPIRITRGAHPVPDKSSADAAKAALALVAQAREHDLIIVALSGGASALVAAPAEEITLEDKIATTEALLKSGASIREFNTVRKHLSAFKGGRLVQALPDGVRIFALILSDVPGDDLATIGSGPTAPDPSTYADSIAVLKRRRLWGRAPERIRDHLERGLSGEIPETSKREDSVFGRVTNVIIGNNRLALDAAAAEASRLGYNVAMGRELKGEADGLGTSLAADLAAAEGEGVCIICGGEPVVTVRGGGRGGRAQHCALSLAIELNRIAPQSRIAALVAGTDGIDGPTDAAGAFVFSDTVRHAAVAGLNPANALRRNNSYGFFQQLGDLFKVGATGTNVADLFVGLVNYQS